MVVGHSILLAWGLSVVVWKFGRLEARYATPGAMHTHVNWHPDGTEHPHRHVN
jgi:hypothetical protein